MLPPLQSRIKSNSCRDALGANKPGPAVAGTTTVELVSSLGRQPGRSIVLPSHPPPPPKDQATMDPEGTCLPCRSPPCFSGAAFGCHRGVRRSRSYWGGQRQAPGFRQAECRKGQTNLPIGRPPYSFGPRSTQHVPRDPTFPISFPGVGSGI